MVMARKTLKPIIYICLGCSVFSLLISIASLIFSPEPKSEIIITHSNVEDTESTVLTTPAEVVRDKNPYDLSDDERACILEVLTGECRGESFIGQMAIAQCIRDASEYYDIRPKEVIQRFKYHKENPEVAEPLIRDNMKLAIQNVFDEGARITPSRIMFFYNPSMVESNWHESQKYVITIDHHRFFDIKEEIK